MCSARRACFVDVIEDGDSFEGRGVYRIRGLDIKEDSLWFWLAREGGRAGGGGEEEEKEGQGGEYLEGKKSSKLVCSAQQPAGGTKGE